MNEELSNPDYWDSRYNNQNDTWSLNSPNPVLVQVIEQKIVVPPGKLLVVGCGKGEDAFHLANAGFDVTGIDFSAEAIKTAMKNKRIEGPALNFSRKDLFEIKDVYCEMFDYVYEYVTLCAVDPARIEEMILNIASVLKPGGQFITIPFPIDGRAGGPPFNIDPVQFYKISAKYLKLEYYAKNINSVKPRKGKEVLMVFRKEI